MADRAAPAQVPADPRTGKAAIAAIGPRMALSLSSAAYLTS